VNGRATSADDRVTLLSGGRESAAGSGPVVCWLSRDQRLRDNWALLYAQQTALHLKSPLVIVFCFVPGFLGAGAGHYSFMLAGLKELAGAAGRKNIGFCLLAGEPETEIPLFLRRSGACLLVGDFDPLRIKQGWKKRICGRIGIPFHEVDAHNIVPCRAVSVRQEFGAYILRPKTQRLLPVFLTEFPLLRKHPFIYKGIKGTGWEKAARYCGGDVHSGSPAGRPLSGEKAASAALKSFISQKLSAYSRERNDPSLDGQSGLSCYLHFGQLSAQRVALEVMRSRAGRADKEAFLEELVVRRELSDNYCFYNPAYDKFGGLPAWAVESLLRHRADVREYVYSFEKLENALTHDPYWNAAQLRLLRSGRMHGYMRMYWGKKILEWTREPEQAFEYAVKLNDKYELDGRDPNGYAGVAWCFGAHDRPWPERSVFGKVRYMNAAGLERKFDMPAYLRRASCS
jgi:deoxyribodipyrimidine photo-lyase